MIDKKKIYDFTEASSLNQKTFQTFSYGNLTFICFTSKNMAIVLW